VTVHLAARPSWTCLACGIPWPCRSRRRELIAEFDGARVSLSLFLAGCFVQAAREQPHVAAGLLYARFLGWARSPHAVPATDEIQWSAVDPMGDPGRVSGPQENAIDPVATAPTVPT
jgi:hypothetical protein